MIGGRVGMWFQTGSKCAQGWNLVIMAFTISNVSSGKISVSSPPIHLPGPPYQTALWSPSKKPPTSTSSLLTRVSAPTGSRPRNRPRCKTCPIHHPTNSFTSSCTNITYPITNHADCKSTNLIYQLQCTECNAFSSENPTVPFQTI